MIIATEADLLLLILGLAGAGIALGSLYLFGDRPGESRTTGTQVRWTEKEQADLERDEGGHEEADN